MRVRLVGVLVAAVMVTVGSPAGAAPDNESTEATCETTRIQDQGPFDQPPAWDIHSDGDVYSNGMWLWDCPPYGYSEGGPPHAPAAHLTIHRLPNGGGRLWVHPGVQYVCRDVHTGAVVGHSDALTMPHPGVACDPTGDVRYAVRCTRVGAGGSHADLDSGAIVITSSCSTFSASHAMTTSSGSGSRTSASGDGRTTWFCQVTESPSAQQPLTDYWVYCDINL